MLGVGSLLVYFARLLVSRVQNRQSFLVPLARLDRSNATGHTSTKKGVLSVSDHDYTSGAGI